MKVDNKKYKKDKYLRETKFYFFLIFYSLLFLFYPGDSKLLNIFAFNRDLFQEKTVEKTLETAPVPVLRSAHYPSVSAEGVYVVELNSFTPIFEKNGHNRFLPASTTKVITALTAYDMYGLDDVFTIRSPKDDGQSMGLVDGEQITFENLLFGMLVHSGNDAATAIAENKGYDKFIDLMNKKAAQLHMKNSRFSNPSGLSEHENYSTPYDLALASRELLKNRELSKIVSTRDITVSDVDFKYFHKLTNINKLLGEIQGLGGLKTGYTENAGENLVSFFKNDRHNYIIVVLKSEDRFEDTKNIIDWIRTNVDYYSIKNSEDTAGT